MFKFILFFNLFFISLLTSQSSVVGMQAQLENRIQHKNNNNKTQHAQHTLYSNADLKVVSQICEILC